MNHNSTLSQIDRNSGTAYKQLSLKKVNLNWRYSIFTQTITEYPVRLL